ncbi:hypothetical protein ABW20_dc0106779 [Dactylellina cionopaga]|nr:hypothetical protein ABW20_dc0106779 [Dactylellina cionopaga]
MQSPALTSRLAELFPSDASPRHFETSKKDAKEIGHLKRPQLCNLADKARRKGVTATLSTAVGVTITILAGPVVHFIVGIILRRQIDDSGKVKTIEKECSEVE